MITLVSVGDRVPSGTLALHARFRRSVHFHGSEGLVALVDERIGSGPVNIVLRDFDPGSIESISVLDRNLVVNGESFEFGDRHIYCSRIDPFPQPVTGFLENLATFEERIVEKAPALSLAFLLDGRSEDVFNGGFEREFARRMSQGVEKLRRGDLAGCARLIRGCGFGLTPSGDDFLAGVLIALNVLQMMDGRVRTGLIDTVFRACGQGGFLSGVFLTLASEGRLDSGMKQLVCALACGDATRIRSSADAVLDHGASSGADLATGFLIALRWDRENGDTDGL